jgi:protease II
MNNKKKEESPTNKKEDSKEKFAKRELTRDHYNFLKNKAKEKNILFVTALNDQSIENQYLDSIKKKTDILRKTIFFY